MHTNNNFLFISLTSSFLGKGLQYAQFIQKCESTYTWSHYKHDFSEMKGVEYFFDVTKHKPEN